MNRLFIRLYLDEDVSVLIQKLLGSRGHDALTTLAAGNVGKPDADQLAFATEQGRAILTHNHGDFEKLAAEYVASGRHHGGIIVAYRRKPAEIAERLMVILDRVPADEMQDQLRYI